MAAASMPALAQGGRFGAGFVFGEPTGIAWKYQMNDRNALDGSIGFSPYDRYRINVDYLWQSYPFNEPRLALHYGVGGALGFGRTDYLFDDGRNTYLFRTQDLGFGVRGVVGMTYLVPRTPMDLFLEVAPLMILAPGTGMGLDAGFGARFYF
jgi:hypothetical protein